MAALNFPVSPTLNDTYAANNVIYTWNGEYWEANTTNSYESHYVNVTGDNMTGDLTLGTDKITLDATDGSASFRDGRCQVNSDGNLELSVDGTGIDESKNSGAIFLSRYGTITINNQDNANDDTYVFSARKHDDAGNSTINSAITVGGNLLLGGTIHTSPNVTLMANGSAEFANSITSGDWDGSGNPTTNGAIVASNGFLGVCTTDTGNQQKIRIRNPDGNRLSIFADGSAQFAGPLSATIVPPSDARFKENITPANPQLADVVALGKLLKNYDWNTDAPLNEELRAQRQLGLVAQEAEEVCPGLVKTINRTKQGPIITPAVTDSEGNKTAAVYEELDDSYKGLSNDVLIMKLLGAVTELKAEVDTLRAAAAE